MLKADPSVRRQLPPAGAAVLWRDRPGGGREGLVLSTQACAGTSCPCREVIVEGWSVSEELLAVAIDDTRARFTYAAKGAGAADEKVLVAAVNIDTGKTGSVEGAAPSKPWARQWLEAELDAELLELLRQRFAAAKARREKVPDWWDQDWSWWKPGRAVSWLDLHLEDAELEVTVGGRTYAFDDLYCVDPGCECEEVRWHVRRLGAGEELESVGEVSLNPTFPTAAQFVAHGRARDELKEAWAALEKREPISGLVFGRREEMRAQAAEIHRRFGKPPKATAPVGRNEPCPCGSGKKFKRCCMEAG